MGEKIYQSKTERLSNGVNAVVHFDYFLGDTIAIEKLKSSIIINNKGELLFPENEFGKRSEARNRLLVDLLARTEYMEKAGTGIKRVADACVENGNKYTFSFSDAFWVTIETNVPDNDTDNDTGNDTDKLTRRRSKMLELIKTNDKITTSELARRLNVSKSTVLRDIEKLKVENKLERVGKERTGRWVI